MQSRSRSSLCSGYQCIADRGDWIYACTSTYSEASVLSLASIYYQTITGTDGSTTGNIVTGETTVSISSGSYVNAKGVIIMRQATDPSWFASGTPSTTSSASGSHAATVGFMSSSSSSSATAAAAEPSPALSESDNSSGMSSGAKVGIAVGAVALVGLALAGLFFLWRSRRAKAREQLLHSPGSADPALHDQSVPAAYWQNEPAEMHAHDPKYSFYSQAQPRSEMDASPTHMFELPGSDNARAGGYGRQ